MIAARTEGHFSCFVYVVQNETSFWTRALDRRRPYRDEYTGSLPNSEVNRRRALSVGEWGTVSEAIRVLLAFCYPERDPNLNRSGAETKAPFLSTFQVASGHTATNTPDLFRTPKLSGVGPG